LPPLSFSRENGRDLLENSAARAFVRVRVGSRRKQGQQGDSDEVAQRRLRPAHLSAALKPGGIDEENDAGDNDLAEPADDEEHRCEDDSPEAQFRQAHCGCEVEHVPRDPEEKRTEEDRCEECRERDGKPARDECADPEDAQNNAKAWAHRPSL
jgi:hypothetical protein